jgi:hypothetical protein
MFSNVKLNRFWFKKNITKKSFGYSHHSAKCSVYTSFKFRVLSLLAVVTLSNASFFFFFQAPFPPCFCTALFLLNHILFITFDWIQHHFRQKKHTFATTSTQDDIFQVCYSKYQPIGATFRGTIYSNTNYTVYFRPVRCNILIHCVWFVFGLYIPLFWLPWIGLSWLWVLWVWLSWITFIQPFTIFFLVILRIRLFALLRFILSPFSARNYFSVAVP